MQEQEKKWRKNDARKSIKYWEERVRDENEHCHRWFRWIHDFLKHFLEVFTAVCNETKKKLTDLIESIETNFSTNNYRNINMNE